MAAVGWFVGLGTLQGWGYRQTHTGIVYDIMDRLGERWVLLRSGTGQLVAVAGVLAILGLIFIRPLAYRWIISELREKKRRAERVIAEIEGK